MVSVPLRGVRDESEEWRESLQENNVSVPLRGVRDERLTDYQLTIIWPGFRPLAGSKR
ncbi:hypothetical protein MICAG_3610005 [Microcystis aeruginosa PCC 9808]|uniref:Uncharacterized protein n=1 Tax=Microcystis aeruginosa PCC 9808 TaxID=1160284 RepID=I4I086_MICAE|nr:hypothetical protein MICAG_3610005 [Microcystis aeruginosa PCC 9808]